MASAYPPIDETPLAPQYEFRGVRQMGPYVFLDVRVVIPAEEQTLGLFTADVAIPTHVEETTTYNELANKGLELARAIVHTTAVLPLLRRR